MKRFSFLLVTLALGFSPMMRAQDAATEERLNKLSGRIEDLIAAQESMRKQIADLSHEVQAVNEKASKPVGNFASQEDLNRLKKAVEEVDRKRIDDAEKVQKQLLKLREDILKNLNSLPPPPKNKPAAKKDRDVTPPPETNTTTTTDNEKVFQYVVQSGDSLSVIVQAYREKNIKVSVDQILKANPGLTEKKLKVGQKIYIPAPQ